MKQHDLRCDKVPFVLVLSGLKRFEIRRDDRGFEAGHVIVLHETKGPEDPQIYTGRFLKRRIVCVIRGYGLQEGFVALGIDE